MEKKNQIATRMTLEAKGMVFSTFLFKKFSFRKEFLKKEEYF